MDINYKLVLDSAEFTQSVQAGLTQLRQLNDELNKTKSTASNAFAQSALDTDKLANKMEEIVKINGQMLIEFGKLGTAIKGATSTSEIKQLNDEIASLKKQIDGLSNSAGGTSGGLGAKMGQLKNQLIQLRVEGKQNTEQYQKLNAEYARLNANIAAVDRTAKQYQRTNKELIAGINDTGQVAALAGANVISFGQVLSDLPYGIRGIANNLQQMTATMVTLIVQAGSAKRAMVALRSAFTGPLGIIVVIQGALAALDYFAGGMEKSKKVTDKAKESVDKYRQSVAESSVEMQIMFGALTKMVKAGEDQNKIKSLAKEINDKYNTTLNTEKVTIEDINKQQAIAVEFLREKIRLQVIEDKLKASVVSEMQAADSIAKYTIEKAAKEREITKLRERQTKELENYEVLRVLIVRAEGESENLGLKIEALEKNKEGHLKNQAIYLQQASLLYQEIYKAKKDGDKNDGKDKELKPVDIDASDLAKEALKRDKEANDIIEKREANLKRIEDLIYRIIIGSEEINVQLGEIENTGEKFPKPEKGKGAIAEWLGLEDKDIEIMLKNIRIIGRELSNIFNEVNEAAQKNNKKVIENLQEVIDETEKKIETETELQQMGLANNLQGEQDYLAQQMALREEAFERQKQLELQKLAIDSISQLSNLITASTGIWNSTSELPQPAGAILAIATIGAMFGSFAVSKAKAAQLVKSQESFEEGGVVQGKRHTQGGERFYSSDGNHMVEIEQGEYVTNRESTSKYMDLLNAINNDEIGSHNIHKLLEGTGVTLPSVDTEIFRRDLKRATVGSLNDSKQSETTQTDLSADIKDIKRYVKDIAEKETIITDGNKTVVKQGSKTIITRRGN